MSTFLVTSSTPKIQVNVYSALKNQLWVISTPKISCDLYNALTSNYIIVTIMYLLWCWYKLLRSRFSEPKQKGLHDVNMGILHDLRPNGFAMDCIIMFVFQEIKYFDSITKKNTLLQLHLVPLTWLRTNNYHFCSMKWNLLFSFRWYLS